MNASFIGKYQILFVFSQVADPLTINRAACAGGVFRGYAPFTPLF